MSILPSESLSTPERLDYKVLPSLPSTHEHGIHNKTNIALQASVLSERLLDFFYCISPCKVEQHLSIRVVWRTSPDEAAINLVEVAFE